MAPNVNAICNDCARQHLDDVEAAFEAAKQQLPWPKLPKWVEILADSGLRQIIHDVRHNCNRQLRKANGGYGGPAKVGGTVALAKVAEDTYLESVFDHSIAGWRFGSIVPGHLLEFADAEEAKADGYMFNAYLCREAAKLCERKKGSTVSECITEKQAKNLFKQVAKQMGRE